MLQGVAALPSGDIALVGTLGMFGMGGGAVAWHSGDGSAWTPVELDGTSASEVAAYPGGFVAIGGRQTRKGEDGVVWTSATGDAWTESTSIRDARLQDILVTPTGIEIVGTRDLEQGYGFPAIWRSPDGVTWDEPIGLGKTRAGFHTIAATPGGARVVVDSAETDGSLWRSEDGATWDRISPTTETNGSTRNYWAVSEVPTGIVMTVGIQKGRRSHIELWHSPDGLTWTPVAVPDTSVGGMVSGPHGILAFAKPPEDKRARYRSDTPGLQLRSDDGLSWCATSDGALAGVGINEATVTADGSIVAVGSTGSLFGPPVTTLGAPPAAAGTADCQPLPSEGLDVTPITFGELVVTPPSTVAACAAGTTAGGTSATGETTYCASDLIASGAEAVGPAKALAAAPKSFAGGPCVKPAGGTTPDRPLLCVYEIASAWRDEQRKTGADGRVSQAGLDRIFPMYQWAATVLPENGRRYLDAGLRRLDELPLGWVRAVPDDPKSSSVVRKARAGSAAPAALNALLQKAWLESDLAPIPDQQVEMPGGWTQADLPQGYDGVGSPLGGMSYWVGPRGGRSAATSLVSVCALALDPAKTPEAGGSIRTETCGRGAASAWLLYLATGDERFIDVAVGIRDMTLRAASAEGLSAGAAGKEKLFFETFDCWLGKGSQNGCYSGL